MNVFIETLGEYFIIQNFNFKKARVCTEYSTNEGRIDILIEDDQKKAIIIENKIYANDQWKQLKRYNKYAEETYKKGNYQILYLTLWGEDASEQSGEGVSYLPISHKKNIINWLEKCVAITARFPMVRETIIQYINHLKTLTNQDMNTKNIDEVVDILSKNIESTFIISDNVTNLRNHLINKVFLPQLSSICKEMGLKNVSGKCDRVNESYAGFQIMNPNWKFFKIGFEFLSKGLGNLIIGINHIDNEIRNDETFEKLKPIFTRKNDKWVFKSFPTYSYWGKEAMIAIQSGEMAKIFKEEIKKILDLTKGFDM